MKELLKNKKVKNEKGAVATLVLFTIIMFIIILMGVFGAVMINAKSQLKSDMRIQELYNKEAEKIDEIYIVQNAIIKDGYNNDKYVNSPKILSGMTPIKFRVPTEDAKGGAVTTTAKDSEWYEYGTTAATRNWANTQTEDGSMWVWIPRYAYRINETEQTVDVKFLIGTTDYYYDDNGEIKQAQRATTGNLNINTKGEKYTVHPAFTDESSIDYVNGGWDEELTGIWVAKFEAGYASGNNSAPVVASAEFYDNNNNNQSYVGGVERPRNQDGTMQNYGWEVARNWLDGMYGTAGATNTSIKYPTFQPLTYSMNYINTSEAYRISKALTGSKNIYGLNEAETDSHLIKNSEWGAIAYLTQSAYGKNSEIAVNNATLNSGGNPRTNAQGGVGVDSVYAVTGCTSGTTNAEEVITTIGSINSVTGNTATSDGVYVWNQVNGQNASSSGTIYGIYDLSGGLSERTAGFASNGHAYIDTYGKALKDETGAITGENGANTGKSTKYIMVYPSNDTGITDLNTAFRANYKNYANNSSIYGDAIREVTDAKAGSETGEIGWNTGAGIIFGEEYKDRSYFPAYYGMSFVRGDDWQLASEAGIYSFGGVIGSNNFNFGFRPVLISKVGGAIESNHVLDYTVLRGNQRKISIPYTGEEATITYQIENTNLATVDSNGVITASSTNTGTTNITATITDNKGNVTSKTYTVTVEMGVARTDNKDYSSLQAAINAVPADNVQREVTILKDTTGSGEIKANQNIILNLNSKTITGASNGNDNTIATAGNLIITGNGTITGASIGVRCWKGGELQILNGTYEGTENAVRQTDTSTMTLNGGTYNSKVAIRCWGTANSTTTINGGVFQGSWNAFNVSGNGSFVINNGTFSATSSAAVHTGEEANLKINKGTFYTNQTSSGNGVIQNESTGNLTIGNIGDSNSNILINSNESTTISGIKSSRNDATIIINSGTVKGYYAVFSNKNTDLTINGGTYTGEKECIVVSENSNLVINDGNFLGKTNSALHVDGSSNIKINKGIFNSNRSDSVWDGVIQHSSSGTITIGNIGDNNENIKINNNDNKNISGMLYSIIGSTIIVNSGTIVGYTGVNMSKNDCNLYLNGGIISGTGGTADGGSGWSVNFYNGNMTNVNVYIKRNTDLSLSGRGKTGTNSIYWTKYITYVD